MPCHNVSHTHNWPRSGSLSIAKCESKCDFCASSKDYKPASALRKHVLTHIKNDKLPLTLEKSTGGRPRLQTVSSVPTSLDQPELPPSGSEIPRAANPVLGNLGADDIIIEPNENNPPLNFVLGLEGDLDPISRLECISEAIQIRRVAVFYLRPYGLEETPLERVDALGKFLKTTLQYHQRDKALAERHYRNQSLWVNIESGYLLSLLALHDVTEEMLPPFTSTTVLDVFYATMILSIIRRLLYDTESRRGVLGPEGDRDYSSMTGSRHLMYLPMMLVLESSDKNLDALFDDIRKISVADGVRRMSNKPLKSPYISWARTLVPESDPGHTLTEQLIDFIDQLESKWKLAGTGGRE